jgi:hypothetical protein
MRAALATTVLGFALTVSIAPPAAARAPSPRQVTRAVTAVKRSKALWATINMCNSRTHRDKIGVRGQMPSLGFGATMEMTVTLNSYSTSVKRFEPINSPDAMARIRLGSHTRGLEQDGANFPFHKGTTGLWDATVVFTWKRNGKIIGQSQRRTTAGHPNADFGSPPHYSAARCWIS